MVRRWLKFLLVLGALTGLVALYESDRWMFRRPNQFLNRSQIRLQTELTNQQVALLYDADRPSGPNWASGRAVDLAGTETRPGRFGRALHFDGARRTFATLPVRWNELGEAFTLALWIRLESVSRDQEIIFTRKPWPLGLKLDRGRMGFFVSSRVEDAPLAAASYAFTNFGHFVQVAVVVDGANRSVRLFENGVPRANLIYSDWPTSDARLTLGKSQLESIGEPLHGDVDDLVVWNRSLSDQEVLDWSSHQRPALETLAPRSLRIHRLAEGLRNVIRRGLNAVDLFNPARHFARSGQRDLPEINLVLSKADEKYFTRAHRQNLRDGRRRNDNADRRGIDVVEQGHAFRARLGLDGSDAHYPNSPRPSFLLEPNPGHTVLGLSLLRLAPPESAGWLAPLLETRVGRRLGVPTISNGLCRLVINGDRKGVYYYEDYRTMGLPNGIGARQVDGIARRGPWRRLAIRETPILSRDELVQIRDDLYREYRRILARDVTSPLSGREVQYVLRMQKHELDAWPLQEKSARDSAAERAAHELTAFSVLSSNPAPFYVLSDLNLDLALLPGVRVEWTSSNPDILNTRGMIRRPDEGGPQAVTLTAHLSDDQTNAQVRMEFRVMPRVRTVPAFFLAIAEPLERLQRVDCAVDYFPEDGAGPPRRWLAAQENRSGVSWRGHTSLRQLKKPIGLRLPEPHGLWGSTNITKINFVNPYRDSTLLRNRLSYDIFRSFGTPDAPRPALPVSWAELFVNGKYFGLYEISPPVRVEWLGFKPYEKGEDYPSLVFKGQGKPPSLDPAAEWLMRQTEPSRRHGHFPEATVDLLRFLEKAPPEELARHTDERIDVANLIDFHLLLEFSKNYNGWPFDFTLHDILVRPAGPGARFFLVPFDFDTTWNQNTLPRYHTRAFRRLYQYYPNYAERMAGRWRELREGPLASETLARRVRELETPLAPYVIWDDRRWERYADHSYAQRVEMLIQMMRQRAEELDVRFGQPGI